MRFPTGAVMAGHLLLPLLAGFTVYVLWRPPTLWLFVWLDHIGLANLVSVARDSLGGVGELLPGVVLYNLPAACWAYSFCASICLIWRGAAGLQPQVAFATALVVVAVGEAVQVIDVVPGVFDWRDLVADLLAGTAAGFIMSRSVPTSEASR